MGDHGFSVQKIYKHLEEFEQETKEERKKYKTFEAFNEAILKAKRDAPLGKICKGIFVGNILLKNARKQEHPYLIAKSEDFIVIIPFGPIQSIVHLMAIPSVPIYNVASVGIDSVLLLKKMQAALVKVVTDLLVPGSHPQKIYLRALSIGISQKSTDISSIRITQKKKNLDTNNILCSQADEIIRKRLRDYYAELLKNRTSLEKVVSTDLHVHPLNSVGQIHMHGWIAEPQLITDNGMKLKYKNTPLDRIIPVLSKIREVEFGEERNFRVNVMNKSEFS